MANSSTTPLWFDAVLQMSESERKEVVSQVLAALKCWNSLKSQPTQEGMELVAMLKADFNIVGIAPNFFYARISPGVKYWNDQFLHKWGCPTLVYHHKKYPFQVWVNPYMRKDEMMLAEMPANRRHFQGVAVIGEVG